MIALTHNTGLGCEEIFSPKPSTTTQAHELPVTNLCASGPSAKRDGGFYNCSDGSWVVDYSKCCECYLFCDIASYAPSMKETEL